MSTSKKFPPSPEIKRVIHAAQMAGVVVSAIELKPGYIRIFSDPGAEDRLPPLSAYDLWKADEEERKRSAPEG